MKKKTIIISLLLICIFMITGCTKVIDLTDEQNDLIAEYAAGVLVQNSYTYKAKYPNWNIAVQEETESETEDETTGYDDENETPQETAAVAPVDETTPQGEDSQYLANASEAFGIESVQVTYKSYKVTDEFPDDPDVLFSVKPEPGYKFIVVSFNLHNSGDEAVVLNNRDNQTILKATINKASVNNFATLLLNDITALSDVTVEAGGDCEAVALFMVTESVADDMESFKISYKYDGKTESLTIK